MDPQATIKLPPAAPKTKILLVEDEANIAAMVVDWLSEQYDVSVAETGKIALQKAALERPALILQDIHLPDMTGFDVVKLLEKDARTGAIPVVFLTGEKMVDETVKFIATVKNVKGYVNKPFRLKEFLEKIVLILGHKTDFIVMEKRPPASETLQRAEMVRDVRAQDQKDILAAARPPIPVPAARPAEPTPRKRGFFRALFSALFLLTVWGLWGLLAAGAAAELACRALEKFAGEWTALPPLVPSVLSGVDVALVPGAAWERNGVSYRVNSLGLRDEEPAPVRSTDAVHVFLLGGSAVFGQGVPLGRTVSKRLEELLNDPPVFAPAAARVVHGALWNRPPKEQWTAYEKLYPRVKPDLTIWVLGEPKLLAPLGSRLRDVSGLPPQARLWLSRSRLADLLTALYVYGGAREQPVGAELAGRAGKFLADNPEDFLMIFALTKEPLFIKGLTAREKLMVFNVAGLESTDLSWKGLTPAGHEALARIIRSSVSRYKDRIRPPAIPPPAPAPKPTAVRRLRKRR